AWPERWKADRGMHAAPHVLKVEHHGCQIVSAEAAPDAVYYAETFIDLPAEREAIVAAQGAYRVAIDDVVVLERDMRVWGLWAEFGVRVRLPAGRHRILARIGTSDTSIRLLATDGTPLGALSSTDGQAGYGVRPPSVGDNPNVLGRFVDHGKPRAVEDDLS